VLAEALATDGLWLLILGASIAGIVRGFAGFGTAMIYIPLAAQVLPPVAAIVTMLVMDIFGPLPTVPKALRDCYPRDLVKLSLGAVLFMPLGIFLLTAMPPETFRYAASIVALVLLITLISGWRYRRVVGAKTLFATGGVAGIFGGAVGLAGPPAILLYMARPIPVAAIRANTMLFLLFTDFLLLALFGFQGLLNTTPVLIGLIVAPFYLASVWIGALIFDPARSSVYRWVAYTIIAVSALTGLPVWG